MQHCLEQQSASGRLTRLRSLIKENAVLFSSDGFRLSSGGLSHFYFDLKRVAQNPEGIFLFAEELFERATSLGVDAIGGIESGGIAPATAVALLSHGHQPIDAFFVRKRPKTHGTGQWIEGVPPREASHVLIVDDVLTTGQAILEGITRLKEEVNCEIVRVIVLVDREEGGREMLGSHGIQVEALFSKHEFDVGC